MAIEVVMPALGLTVEKGTIVEWFKTEGDFVKKGEPLFEVEADKVTTGVESPASGILSKIIIQTDVEVPILTVVGIILEAGEALLAGLDKYLGCFKSRSNLGAFCSEQDIGVHSPKFVIVHHEPPVRIRGFIWIEDLIDLITR